MHTSIETFWPRQPLVTTVNFHQLLRRGLQPQNKNLVIFFTPISFLLQTMQFISQ